jgi:hypothetical protein
LSRRKKTPAGTHVMYGLLKLKCLVGHELGAVLATRHSVYRLTTDQLDTFKKDEEVQGAEQVASGSPIRSICPICKQEGRSKYWYEQSWEIVDAELRAELNDSHSAQRTITLY